MKNKLILFLIFLFFGFSVASENIKLFDRIVMVVNGTPVLKSELELAMQWFGIKDRRKAAQKLIDQILIAQAAEKYGIMVSPEEINSAIMRIVKANGMRNIDEFKKKLQESNLSFLEFKDLIKRELLIQRYIQIHLRRSLFEGIKEGKEVTLRKIRIIFLSSEKPDFKEKYQYIKQELNRKNFSELAKKYSDDSITASKGGLLGSVRKGDLIENLDERIWEHNVGDIFEVPVKNGVYFILIEKEEKKIVQEQPTGKEIAEKLKEEYELQLKKLKEQATIEYLDKSLEGGKSD